MSVAAGRPYEILIGHGLSADLPDRIAARCPATGYAVITDSLVAPLYAAPLAAALERVAPTRVFNFPAGEWNKTRETWTALTDQLLEWPLGRDGAIVAIGGGVAGDMAGFVAATYLRGVPYVQVPTSLLAMIDSSIGGKTGVDTSHGKNLVGAFHQPNLVIADVATLGTLPPNQFAAGVAEAVKHGAVADADYLAWIAAERDPLIARVAEPLVHLVRRSVEIKSAVVADDEHERGRRAILNFGHTVAHAIELAAGFDLLHGEAVAIGMLAEAAYGTELGITDSATVETLHDTLTGFDLPLTVPPALNETTLIEAMHRDKKSRDATVRVTLLERVGTPALAPDGSWTHPVEEPDLPRLVKGFLS